MCGIAGFLQKDGAVPAQAADAVVEMLLALNTRGPDSAGLALYGPVRQGGFVVRAWYDADEERAARAIETVKERWPVPTADLTEGYARLEVTTDASAGDVAEAVDGTGLAVF